MISFPCVMKIWTKRAGQAEDDAIAARCAHVVDHLQGALAASTGNGRSRYHPSSFIRPRSNIAASGRQGDQGSDTRVHT